MPIGRSCGECEACCTVMGVSEIGKLPMQPCNHQGKGCAIYNERPTTCRGFECMWLYDQGGRAFREKERPDKCGVMFVPAGQDSAFFKGTRIQVVVAHECYPNAFEMYHGDRIIRRLRSRWMLALVKWGQSPGDSPTLVGPPLLMRRAHEWLTSQRG